MANLAVIQTGGKQYLVKPGDKLRVEKLEAKPGETLKFEPLMVADDTGKEVQIGKPTVKGSQVSAVVVEHGRADKVEVVKFKAKIRYKRRAGHRQPFTLIKIEAIK